MTQSAKPGIMIVGGNFIGKGAEAMMLTVRDTIREAKPNAICCVPSQYPKDEPAYESHGIRPIRIRRLPRMRRGVDFALSAIGLTASSPVPPDQVPAAGLVNPFRASELRVDIAGFASSDQFGPRAAFGRWRQCRLARRAGNRLVFMPQAWGPFNNKWVRRFTGAMLREAEFVFAREQQSYEYLKTLSIGNTELLLAPDVAFGFHGGTSEDGWRVLNDAGLSEGDGPLIGMTPNMRICERTPGEGSENTYLRSMTSLVQYFVDEQNARVVLIPHEQSRNRVNDPEVCQMIIDATQRPGRVCMLSGAESAAEIKAAIGCVDFLVASRYHSLIAALSVRVPVAVIGWSHKYDEVMKAVGIEQWVVDPVRRSGDTTNELVIEAWKKRDTIRAAEEERVPELERASQAALDRLRQSIV